MVKPPTPSSAAGRLTKRAGAGVLERARKWLAPVYERYSKNVLTHGEEYLRGDPEIPIGLEVEDWRAVPSLDHISLSRATLTATDSGGILLQGRYGGPLTAAQMLTGSALTEKPENAVGAGVCGMGSTGRWPWDLAQHHWLELQIRTDGRPYELVLQCESSFQRSQWVWRADIPQGPRPAKRAAAFGPHALLGIAPDASVGEVQRAYRLLAMQHHPDRGGSEERFKALSRAYKRLTNEGEAGAEYAEPDEHDELSGWRTIKMPFTAFKDFRFHEFSETVAHMYILLRDDEPGPFALELGGIKAGRCEKGTLPAAGFHGNIGCEIGHCECGYYNGLRVQGFEGPVTWPAPGEQLPEGVIERGFAEHHVEDKEGGGMW